MSMMLKKASSFLKQMKQTKSKKSKCNLSFQQNADEYGDGDLSDFSEFGDVSSGVPKKLFTANQDLNDKLVGVVITILQGSSYDEMFRSVQPSTVSGERISTYMVSCSDAQQLHAFLAAPMPVPDEWKPLVEDVSNVAADSVVFNWECCSGCGDHCFPGCEGKTQRTPPTEDTPTMRLIGLALQRGHTVMCSDFSLKSLIYEWSDNILGPNPFVKLGGFSGQFKLEFIPEELQNEEVPQQLQVVGELCKDQGHAMVSAMGNTIVYSVNPKRVPTDLYDLKVLTVVNDVDIDRSNDFEREAYCCVGEGKNAKQGVAGHVTLTYKSGGQLVTSMGHWIELTRVNTSVDDVFRVAQKNFGEEEVAEFKRELNCSRTDTERFECMQRRSISLVQKSMPSRMKCRTKY